MLYLVLHLILVHAPDGQVIEINPSQVSSLRDRGDGEGHFHKSVNCVLTMTNGKFIAVTEPCQTIVEMIEKEQ
jgi:hypothetical protein